jgi:hypothetical protein
MFPVKHTSAALRQVRSHRLGFYDVKTKNGYRDEEEKTHARVSGDIKGRTRWPFPRATLEEALKIPYAIKEHNAGNPWEPDEVRKAIGAGTGNSYFYLTATSRDYGFTVGTRNTAKISLGDLGRDLVYTPNPDVEKDLKVRAFLNIDIFKRVLEYYKGSNLPDMKYLGNVLQNQFALDPETGNYTFDIGHAMCCDSAVATDSEVAVGAPEQEIEITGEYSASAGVPDYETLTYVHPVFLPAEVLAVAEDIVGDSDVIGLERDRLEWLLRAVLYIDRQLRAQKKAT